MLKVSYIKIYKCKNRYRERETGLGGAGPCAPSPGSFCRLSFFLCVFFTKKTPNKNKIPASRWLPELPSVEALRDGGGAAGLVPLQRLSRGVLAPPQRLPRGLGSAGASPRKRGAGKAGGGSQTGKHWGVVVGWGGHSPHALAGKTPHSFVGSAQGRWDPWLSGDPGGLPSAPPGEGESRPDPKTGSGEVLGHLHPLPELNSSPCSVPHPGVIPRTPPQSDPAGLTPKLLLGNNPRLPLLGGSTAHTPVLGWNPGRAARMCLGQEEEGVGGRTERTEPSHGGKSRILENPFWVFFSKLSLFPTPFFFVFFRSHLQQCHNKTLECPSCPCGASPSLQAG